MNYKNFLFLVSFAIIASEEQLQALLDKLINQRHYSLAKVSERKNSSNRLWNRNLIADSKNISGRYSWAGDYKPRGFFKKKPDASLDYLAMLNQNLNKQITQKNPALKLDGSDDIILTIPSVIDTSRWMDHLWEFIKDMPANQFIFPGTHDTLSGHDKIKHVLNISNDKSKVQENLTFKQQLETGVRLFDIRFVNRPSWHKSKETVKNMLGVHSGVVFQVNVQDFINELKNYFADNKKDILIIGLSLAESSSITGSSKFSPDTRWDEFIELLIKEGLDNKIIKNDKLNPSSLLSSLSKEGNIIIQSNNIGYNGKYKKYFWAPSEGPGNPDKSWDNEKTPQEWFEALIKLDYEKYPLSSDKVFSYLPMTQGGADGKATWLMNGVLGDWLLFANDDTPEDERPRDFINNTDKKFVLPYPKYKDANGQVRTMQNFNLVNVDYVDRSAFIINCITQNLKVSRKFS